MYKCKSCGADARLEHGVVVKSCLCNCAVIADLSGTVVSHGGVSDSDGIGKILDAFAAIGRGILERVKHG